MRLFKVLYPLALVTVDVHERQAEDFDRVEFIVLRLIGAGLRRMDWIAGVLGLEERHVQQFVHLLIGYSHVEETAFGALHLTELGRESLARGKRLSETVARQTLLCDAISGRPVPRELYGAMHKLTNSITFADWHAALPLPNLEFDRAILDEVQKDPDNHYFNVVDEVTKIGDVHHVELSFLPGWLMEYGSLREAPNYRFFTTLRVPFDDVPAEVMRFIVDEPAPDEATLAKVFERYDQVENFEWTPDKKGLVVKIRAGVEMNRIRWALPFLGRDAESARPHPPIDELERHGNLLYYWTDSDQLLVQAGSTQALIELRDKARQRRLTRESIPDVCLRLSKRLGVDVDPAALHEGLTERDPRRLKELLWELRPKEDSEDLPSLDDETERR